MSEEKKPVEMGVGEAMKSYEKMFDAQTGISLGQITKLYFSQMQDIKQNFSILGLEMKQLKDEKSALVEQINVLQNTNDSLRKQLQLIKEKQSPIPRT